MSADLQVTFQTDFFKPIPGEDEATNPGIYGKALAMWVADALRKRGVAVEDVIAEDFGWVVMVARKPLLLWLGCGNIDGSTTRWTVFPCAEAPILGNLLKKADPAKEVETLRAHLAALVPDIPGVSDIVWD